MTQNPQQYPMFHIDVTPDPAPAKPRSNENVVVALLSELLSQQKQQNKLLEDLLQQTSANQKQRSHEIGQWKEANPYLSENCRTAAETLSKVQTAFLAKLTDEIAEYEDCLLDGEFMLNEFIDRYGPRLAHLNGVLQVLSQLSTAETPAKPR